MKITTTDDVHGNCISGVRSKTGEGWCWYCGARHERVETKRTPCCGDCWFPEPPRPETRGGPIRTSPLEETVPKAEDQAIENLADALEAKEHEHIDAQHDVDVATRERQEAEEAGPAAKTDEQIRADAEVTSQEVLRSIQPHPSFVPEGVTIGYVVSETAPVKKSKKPKQKAKK